MKKELIELLNKEELYEIGFAKIEYFKYIENLFILQEKHDFKTQFQTGDVNLKTFKNETVFKTAIVVLMPYCKVNKVINKNYACVASSFCGTDYHIVFKEKLKSVSLYLNNLGFLAEIYVDNNSLDERYLAYKAGLGFYGLNHLLINDKYGSFFYIGVILTDAVFDYDLPLNKTCLMCKKCIQSCPNKAIKDNGEFDGNACVSYITQKKNLLPHEEKFINQCIFGCDICSNVCPHNVHVDKCNDSDIFKIDVNKYTNLSNRKFMKLYGKYSFAWRGRNIFERNLNIYKQKLEKKDKL